MAHLLTGDGKFSDLAGGGEYRFARTRAKRGIRMRGALRRVNGGLKTMIDAVASSKVQRVQRELQLRGIRFDSRSDNWMVPGFETKERS